MRDSLLVGRGNCYKQDGFQCSNKLCTSNPQGAQSLTFPPILRSLGPKGAVKLARWTANVSARSAYRRPLTLCTPTLPSSPGVKIKPRQLLPRVFNVLLRLHAHVEYGAILAGADDLVVQTPLTPLALRP